MSRDREILDYFEDFGAAGRIVIARKFPFESQARLYAARLTEAGIPNFLSNTNTAATLPIPLMGIGSVSLHVREADLPAATRLMDELDQEARQVQEEETFYEADESDIEFQRELTRGYQSDTRRIIFWVAIVIVLLLILRAFLRAAGVVDGSWDPF